MTKPASLMGLPTELQLLIAEQLSFPESNGLKYANRHFYTIVKPLRGCDLRSEERSPFGVASGLFACKDCLRLRRSFRFADQMRKGKRGKNGSEGYKRFCLDCGLNPKPGTSRYTAGNRIVLQGNTYLLCLDCNELKPGTDDPNENICRDCMYARYRWSEMDLEMRTSPSPIPRWKTEEDPAVRYMDMITGLSGTCKNAKPNCTRRR